MLFNSRADTEREFILMEAHRLERDFHTASYECHLIQSDSWEAIWKHCTFFVPHQFITNVLVYMCTPKSEDNF